MLYAGCFPTYPVVSGNSAYLTCPDDLITRALAYAINTPSVKTVVLSGYGNLRIQGNRFHQHEFLSHDQIAENLAMLRVGLDKTLSALGKAGKKVIFVVDNPELLNDPRSCLARLGPSSCTLKVPKELYIARSHLYLSLLEELKENYPEVRFTNTVDFFCDNEYCYGQGPTGLWYATRDHLTTLGSQEFVKYFHGLF
jgi:hypothetical protein